MRWEHERGQFSRAPTSIGGRGMIAPRRSTRSTPSRGYTRKDSMRLESSRVSIGLLEHSQLEDAITLINDLFPDEGEKPAESLRAIFEPHRHPLDWAHGICDRVCWVATENAGSRLLGVVGLYRVLSEPSVLYLGWFGVVEYGRGQGLGGELLIHAIAEAKCSGVPYLRLETTEEPYLAAANRLYERHGLLVYRRNAESPTEAWPTIWRELALG